MTRSHNLYIIIKVIFVLTILQSYNAFSIENISNDFKWKTKKFESTRFSKLDYAPKIMNSISSSDPVFFNLSDSVATAKKYAIKNLLKLKLMKRNIVYNSSEQTTLVIDSLTFKEYTASISVSSAYDGCDLEHIESSEIDYLEFKTHGRIQSKN